MNVTRHLRLLSWLMIVCAGTSPVAGSTKPLAASWDPDSTAPLVADVESAAAHARAIQCKTPSCHAIIIIDQLMDIAQYEVGDSNGVASLYTGHRPQIAGHRLDRVLLDNPAVYGSVCAMAARLLSRVHPDEMFVPVTLLLDSVDMNMRHHEHCAETLVAALPRDPGNDQARMNARDLCVNGFEHHHRTEAACAVLVQRVDEKAAVARGLEP